MRADYEYRRRRRRAILCWMAIIGTPCLAAAAFLSTIPLLNHLLSPVPGPIQSAVTAAVWALIAAGAGASLIGPTLGAAFLSDNRTGLRLATAGCYGIMGLLIYLTLWFGAILIFE